MPFPTPENASCTDVSVVLLSTVCSQVELTGQFFPRVPINREYFLTTRLSERHTLTKYVLKLDTPEPDNPLHEVHEAGESWLEV